MSSEAETIGRQAVMAWRIDHGSYDGQVLDGLRVVAAVSGDRNLGIREIGGEAPSFVRAVVYVDERANDAQRAALARLAQTLSRGLISEVVRVAPGGDSVRRHRRHGRGRRGSVANLTVKKSVEHGPACGAMKWFTPFSRRGQPGARDDAGSRVHRPRPRCPLERAESQVGVLRGVQLRAERADVQLASAHLRDNSRLPRLPRRRSAIAEGRLSGVGSRGARCDS